MRMRNKPLKPFNTSSVNLSRENKKKSLIALIKKKREKERWYFDLSLTRLYTPFQGNAFYVSSRKFFCTSTFRRYLCARDFTRRMKNEIMMTKKKKKSESLSLVKKFFTNFESFDNEMLGGREIIKAKALFIHGGHTQLYPGYNWADIDDTVSDWKSSPGYKYIGSIGRGQFFDHPFPIRCLTRPRTNGYYHVRITRF